MKTGNTVSAIHILDSGNRKPELLPASSGAACIGCKELVENAIDPVPAQSRIVLHLSERNSEYPDHG